MRALVFVALLLAACDTGPTAPPADPPPPDPPPAGIVYPLSVSDDGRTLLDSLGRPLLLHGDAAWSLIANVTLEEAERYLDDRRAKGFNAIYVNLIETAFTDQSPPWVNVYGDAPFTEAVEGTILDFTTPNEPYWAHVDRVLQAAAERDILVFAFPAYMGWMQQFDGWSYALDANGTERMRSYGEFVGRRYAGQPNIVWVAGGDWGPVSDRYDLVDEVAAWVAGVRAHDDAHLWTGHGGQESGTEVYGYLGLDLNTTYRYPPEQVPEAIQIDVRRAPRIPVLFFEGWYENEWSTTPARLRYQAYTSLLSGAMGHFYGNNPMWFFGDGWEAALDTPGARHMAHLASVFASRPFQPFLPQPGSQLVQGDRGGVRDGTFVAAARASGGQTSLVYVPGNRTVSVDLGQAIAGETVRMWCVDPQSGQATDLGTRAAQGATTVQPCAQPDWLLVLDDADLDLGAPGADR